MGVHQSVLLPLLMVPSCPCRYPGGEHPSTLSVATLREGFRGWNGVEQQQQQQQ